MIYRNIADTKNIELNMEAIDMIGNVSLNLFLTLALMNLNISKLISLAGPMVAILVVQTVVFINICNLLIITFFINPSS